MEDWEEDLDKGFLKVNPGEHELLIKAAPIKRTNNYGKEQWLFEQAVLDGQPGKITPPKKLLKLISMKRQEKEKSGAPNQGYPIFLKFSRVGMDLNSEFRTQAPLDTA